MFGGTGGVNMGVLVLNDIYCGVIPPTDLLREDVEECRLKLDIDVTLKKPERSAANCIVITDTDFPE